MKHSQETIALSGHEITQDDCPGIAMIINHRYYDLLEESEEPCIEAWHHNVYGCAIKK